MTSIFISYSRKDLDFAGKIVQTLAENDLDTWVDWKSIPKGEDWEQEIYRGIEEAETFLFLISPDSIKSDICNREVAHAVKNNKRIVPLLVRDADIKNFFAETPRKEISRRNWIFARDGHDNFGKAIEDTLNTIHTDYEWLKYHTRLQVKTLEWERSNHENSFLINGKELQDAELKLATNSSRDPNPTDLQREYVLKSRQTADRRRRVITAIAVVGAVVMAVLAVFGFVQARLAEERANIALARNATIASVNLRDKQLNLALLLGIEANKRLDNFETRSVLFDNLRFSPRLLQFLYENNSSIEDNTDDLPIFEYGEQSRALSPNGNMMAIGYQDGRIRLWERTKQKFTGELNIEMNWVSIESLAFSPDGSRLASGTDAGLVFIWNVNTQTLFNEPLDGSFEGSFEAVDTIVFSNDGNQVAFSDSAENYIHIYDLQGNREPYIGGVGSSLISALAFSPDDTLLASGSVDGGLTVWTLEETSVFFPDLPDLKSPPNEAIHLEFIGHNDVITNLEFSVDGRTLVSTSANSIEILWAIDRHDFIEQSFASLEFGDGILRSGGKFLVYKNYSDEIDLWNLNTHNVFGKIVLPDGRNEVLLTFNQDNDLLTYSTETGAFTLWNVVTEKPIGKPLAPQTAIISASYSPDGTILALGDSHGIITLWSVTTQDPISQLTGHSDMISKMEFSLDGKLLISSSADKQIIIWDLDTKKLIHEPLASNGVMALNPNGKTLAFGDPSGIPVIFDVTKYEVIRMLLRKHKEISSLSFNKDGSILASTGYDWDASTGNQTIILWDMATGQPIGQPIHNLEEGLGISFSGIFSPDGTTLITNDNLGYLTLWDVNVPSWINRACQIAGRNFTRAEWEQYFLDKPYPIKQADATCPQWPLEPELVPTPSSIP